MNEWKTMTVEQQGHVFLVGLDRTQKLNAFNLAMLRELSLAFGAFQKDSALRCLLLYAHGEHFTSGLDLAEVGPAVASGNTLFPHEGLDPLGLSEPRLTKPFICAVQGYCLTIGVELLLAADIRLAAENTKLSQMEVKRGIIPFGGATQRLPRLTGWGNAMRYLLTGDTFSASEALRIGIVQEVTPKDDLLERAKHLAFSIAKQAPLAVQKILQLCRQDQLGVLPQNGMQLQQEATALMKTEDAQEGLASFVERREAVFKGR